MKFFEDLGGFLFQPREQCKLFLTEENLARNLKWTLLLVLYGAIILGFTSCFLFLYPERLYYGVIRSDFRNLQMLNLSQPIIIIAFISLGPLIGLIHFFGAGLLNYLIIRLLIWRKGPDKRYGYKNYLTVFGYSSQPLLLFSIVYIFWVYFFEKFYISTDIFPFFDFSILNIISFILLFLFVGWKWFIELRINQEFFEISWRKAIIPEIVQFGFLIFNIVLIELAISIIAQSFAWV